MTRKAQAKTLFAIGCGIIMAASAQVVTALSDGRPAFAIVGAICIAIAVRCCVVNRRILKEEE